MLDDVIYYVGKFFSHFLQSLQSGKKSNNQIDHRIKKFFYYKVRHQKDGKRKIPKFRNECMNVWNSSLTVIPDFLYGYNQFLWNNLLSQCGTIEY